MDNLPSLSSFHTREGSRSCYLPPSPSLHSMFIPLRSINLFMSSLSTLLSLCTPFLLLVRNWFDQFGHRGKSPSTEYSNHIQSFNYSPYEAFSSLVANIFVSTASNGVAVIVSTLNQSISFSFSLIPASNLVAVLVSPSSGLPFCPHSNASTD